MKAFQPELDADGTVLYYKPEGVKGGDSNHQVRVVL